MTDPEEYRRAVWFAAGYAAARRSSPADAAPGPGLVAAGLDEFAEARSAQRRGACLSCLREGVVLMNGLFCERCHHPLDPVEGAEK